MLYFIKNNIAEIHIDLIHDLSKLLKAQYIGFKINKLPYKEIYRGNNITTVVFYNLTAQQKVFLEDL